VSALRHSVLPLPLFYKPLEFSVTGRLARRLKVGADVKRLFQSRHFHLHHLQPSVLSIKIVYMGFVSETLVIEIEQIIRTIQMSSEGT
jgi:hypothetical protein